MFPNVSINAKTHTFRCGVRDDIIFISPGCQLAPKPKKKKEKKGKIIVT
jgi:hypothetical protein